MKIKDKSILSATIGVSFLIIVGKLLGFGRVALLAAFFGATADTDAFFFAQNMPEMIFPAVCNSLSMAFIPLYIYCKTKHGDVIGDRYASNMLCVTTVIGIILSITGIIIIPFIIPILAPGFVGYQVKLTVQLTRLTMGALVFTMINYMLCGILSSNKQYNSPQIATLFYSTTIIILLLLLGNNQSMVVLTWIVIFGLIIQVFVLFYLSRSCFNFSFSCSIKRSDIIQLLKLALPILLGSSLTELNAIVDKALGSTLPQGSLSALSYSNSLTGLVVSVFITALSTVLYPTMVTSMANENYQKFYYEINASLSVLSLLLIPISCITIISSKNIVSIAFGRGNFDNIAVEYTAVSLACYAPMFAFQGIREILTKAYFALKNTRTPAINSAIGVIFNVILSIILVHWFGIMGIALGTSISSAIIAGLLIYSIKSTLTDLKLKKFFVNFTIQLVVGIITLIILIGSHKLFNFDSVFIWFVVDSIVGFSSYFIILYVLGNKELHSISLLIRTRYNQIKKNI